MHEGRKGKEEKEGRRKIGSVGGAGVAVLENDGSTGNRQKTTMGPPMYEMRRKADAEEEMKRKRRDGEEKSRRWRTMTIIYIITRNGAAVGG